MVEVKVVAKDITTQLLNFLISFKEEPLKFTIDFVKLKVLLRNSSPISIMLCAQKEQDWKYLFKFGIP